MTPTALHALIAQGESETLELKRSTAELKRAGERHCAFLNGEGGRVLIGVARRQGTNRVIEACRAYGIAEPTFTEGSGAVTVTFKAEVVAGARDLVPGEHQVGTKSVPSSSAGTCRRSARSCRAHGPLGPHRPHQVPGPSRRAPAGGRPSRDDHPGQASELETAVPHHRGWARGPARWLVIGGPAWSSWIAARAHRPRRRAR